MYGIQDRKDTSRWNWRKMNIKKYRTDYNGPASGDGEKNSHTLESNGTALIEIKTQKDASGK